MSLKSSFVLAACFCFGTAALAQSDEAIADGETLLKTLQIRVSVGEVWPQDLAIARFYLLELRRAAGKLPEAAFCEQAQAELRIASTIEGDEVTKAGLIERKEAIEAMTRSPELCKQSIAAIDAFLFDSGEPPPTPEAVAEARNKYRTGDIDRSTLLDLEAGLAEAQVAAGKLTREAYCASGQRATLGQLVDSVEQRASVGQAGLLERLAAKRRLWAFRALCR
ncbi:MAG TPA: hypothetical protein VMI56_03675 [Reyranella sp.]|nr:hypothetical protein [Reyranella sp.]